MPYQLLITGTSHTGKSTLAAEIGEALGWPVTSTDRMGRHPGRPWENAPPHVQEFYEKMSADAIHTFLLHHHQNMRSGIARFIDERQSNKQPFILEGAALRPEYFAERELTVVCLHARDAFLRARMKDSAEYEHQSAAQKIATDAFIARSLRENALFKKTAQIHGIELIDVEDVQSVSGFARCFVAQAGHN